MAQLDRLTAKELIDLGTATISESSEIDPACRPSVSSIWPGGKLCGLAYTIRCYPGDNLAIHHALENNLEGRVLIIDTAEYPGGYWGEVLSVAAIAKGVKGIAINSGVRDVEAIEKLKFPVFAKNINIVGTRKNKQGELQIPLDFEGTKVYPNDIVIGDRDGLVILPSNLLERTLVSARRRVDKEKKLIDQLKMGSTTVDLYNLKKRKTEKR